MNLDWLNQLANKTHSAHYPTNNAKDAHSHTRSNFLMARGNDVIGIVSQGVVKRLQADGHFAKDWEIILFDALLNVKAKVELDSDAPIRAAIGHIIDNELWVFTEDGVENDRPISCRQYRITGDSLEELSRSRTTFAISSLKLAFDGRKAVATALDFVYVLALEPEGLRTIGQVKYAKPVKNEKELFFTVSFADIQGDELLLLGTALDDQDRSWAHLRFHTPAGESDASGQMKWTPGPEKVIYNRGGFGMAWYPDQLAAFWDVSLTGFDVTDRNKMKAAGVAKLWNKLSITQILRVENEFLGFGTSNYLKRAKLEDGKIQKLEQIKLKTRVEGILVGDKKLYAYDAKKGIFLYDI